MHQYKHTKLAHALSVALLAGSYSSSVIAEETSADNSDDVVVTISRKRPENLQEVPISIKAFDNTEIEQAGVTRPADLINLIPNVSIVDTANVGDTQVTIRGIVSTRDAESTFAYVVDGVLVTNPNGFNEELLDIAQIEVLKGPQGALYGRNAVSGAILVTTTEPSEQFEGKVTVGVGNNGTQKFNATIGGGIAENTTGRFTISSNSTDGHYSNTFTGADDSVDYLEDTTFRGRIHYEKDDFTLDVRAGRSEVEGGAINFNAVFAIPSFEQIFGAPGFYADVNDHNFVFANNVPGENEQETTEFSVKADWDLDGYDVTAVFAYNDLEEYLLSDGTAASFYSYELTPQCQADRATLNNAPTALGGANRTDLFGDFFNPFGIFPPGVEFTGVYGPYTPTACDGFQYQERNQTDSSLEIRFTSDDPDAELRWIAGVYFADIERDVVVAYGADTGAGFLRQPYVGPTGPNPTDLLFDDTFNTTVYSAFGQIEYDLAPDMELSFALRYDNEDRDVTNNVPNVLASGLNVNTFFNGQLQPINPAFVANPNGIPDRSASFDQIQPKVTLSYQSSEDVNWFASYGVGFRSGGFNNIGTEALINQFFNFTGQGTPGDAVNAQLQVRDEYDKEVTTNLEFGVKSKLLDGNLRLNAAVFSTEVEDNQFFEFYAGPFGILRTVTTIDELEIQGFEADFNATVSDSVSIYGGIGLIDSEIKENQHRPVTVGNSAPQAPDESYTLGVSWFGELTEEIFVSARMDWQYVGETEFHTLQGEQTPTIWDFFGTLGGAVPPGPHPQDFSRATRDAYDTLNLRVSFEGEDWVIAVWGKNITDEQFLQEVIPAPEFGGSFIHPSARDSYGIDFTYSF